MMKIMLFYDDDGVNKALTHRVYLQSPGGTRSTLLHNRPQVSFIQIDVIIDIIVIIGMVVVTTIFFYSNIFQDFSSSGFTNWAFMTTHSWGESPIGKWQVSIVINIIIVVIIAVIIVVIPSLRSTTTHTATGVRKQNSFVGL